VHQVTSQPTELVVQMAKSALVPRMGVAVHPAATVETHRPFVTQHQDASLALETVPDLRIFLQMVHVARMERLVRARPLGNVVLQAVSAEALRLSVK
jgi:hypothetical protein